MKKAEKTRQDFDAFMDHNGDWFLKNVKPYKPPEVTTDDDDDVLWYELSKNITPVPLRKMGARNSIPPEVFEKVFIQNELDNMIKAKKKGKTK